VRFTLLFLLASLTVAPAQSLTMRARTSTPPEMGTLHYLELFSDGHTYTVVPPARWDTRLDAAAARLQFFAPTGSVIISLRFVTNAARAVNATADTLRQHVAPGLDEAVKLAEFDIFTGNGAGRAAEFSYPPRGHTSRCRLAAVPAPGGAVLFSVHSSPDEFVAAQQFFGAVLNTFQRTSRTAEEKAAAESAPPRTLVSGGPGISGD
jgi:hypothetical protein